MSAGAKFREIGGWIEAHEAEHKKRDQDIVTADQKAHTGVVLATQLALYIGAEVVEEKVGDRIRISYRRRLPRWLAWLRKVRR